MQRLSQQFQEFNQALELTFSKWENSGRKEEYRTYQREARKEICSDFIRVYVMKWSESNSFAFSFNNLGFKECGVIVSMTKDEEKFTALYKFSDFHEDFKKVVKLVKQQTIYDAADVFKYMEESFNFQATTPRVFVFSFLEKLQQERLLKMVEDFNKYKTEVDVLYKENKDELALMMKNAILEQYLNVLTEEIESFLIENPFISKRLFAKFATMFFNSLKASEQLSSARELIYKYANE